MKEVGKSPSIQASWGVTWIISVRVQDDSRTVTLSVYVNTESMIYRLSCVLRACMCNGVYKYTLVCIKEFTLWSIGKSPGQNYIIIDLL